MMMITSTFECVAAAAAASMKVELSLEKLHDRMNRNGLRPLRAGQIFDF